MGCLLVVGLVAVVLLLVLLLVLLSGRQIHVFAFVLCQHVEAPVSLGVETQGIVGIVLGGLPKMGTG